MLTFWKKKFIFKTDGDESANLCYNGKHDSWTRWFESCPYPCLEHDLGQATGLTVLVCETRTVTVHVAGDVRRLGEKPADSGGRGKDCTNVKCYFFSLLYYSCQQTHNFWVMDFCSGKMDVVNQSTVCESETLGGKGVVWLGRMYWGMEIWLVLTSFICFILFFNDPPPKTHTQYSSLGSDFSSHPPQYLPSLPHCFPLYYNDNIDYF